MHVDIDQNNSKIVLPWLFLGLVSLLAISLLPVSNVLNLFHDDSFFYMVIARNYAAGLGYSFDGMNQTNGFHPLWLWLLSIIGSIASLSGDLGIRIVVVVQSLLSIGAALVYVRLLAIAKVKSFFLILFYFAYLFLCTLADIGQESALFGFLFALLISRIFTQLSESISANHLSLAIIFSLGVLIVLTRLDSFFILGAVVIALWMNRKYSLAYSLVLSVLCGIALTFCFNYIEFGHPYSISSWLKSGFDVEKVRQIFIPGLLIRVLLVVTMLLIALWAYVRQGMVIKLSSPKRVQLISWPAALTLCALFAYSIYFLVLFFEVSALGSWYFNQALGFSLFLLAFSAADISNDSSEQPSIAVRPVIALAAALFIGLLLTILKMGWAHSSDPTKEMGEWLAANTEPSTVIFQRDGAGAVSYFSQRHIINGDGLVNNMPYQVMLRNGKLCQYLNDQKVQYIVTNTFVNSAGLIQDFIFLWTKGVDSIPLTNVPPGKALFSTSSAPTYRVFHKVDAASYCP